MKDEIQETTHLDELEKLVRAHWCGAVEIPASRLQTLIEGVRAGKMLASQLEVGDDLQIAWIGTSGFFFDCSTLLAYAEGTKS